MSLYKPGFVYNKMALAGILGIVIGSVRNVMNNAKHSALLAKEKTRQSTILDKARAYKREAEDLRKVGVAVKDTYLEAAPAKTEGATTTEFSYNKLEEPMWLDELVGGFENQSDAMFNDMDPEASIVAAEGKN